ncbi:MAG TPA: sugar transferase, partial [Anaerolineales bacterium]|nr:sugar transferase [Anaerolineales bacterium]
GGSSRACLADVGTSPTPRRPWRLRSSERRWLLIAGDFLAAAAAAVVALYLWSRLDYLGNESLATFIRLRAPWFPFVPLIWPLLMVDLYDLRLASSWRHTLRGLALAAGAGVVIYLIVYFTAGQGSLPRRGVLYFLASAVVLTFLWRLLYVRVFTAPALMRRVLLVGAGESGQELLTLTRQLQPGPFHIVGLVDDDPAKQGKEFQGVRVLGDNRRLLEIANAQAVTDIIVAIQGAMNGAMFQALLDAQQAGIEITRMPVAYEELMQRVPIQHLESDWILRSFVDEVRVSGVYQLTKRLMDLAGGFVGVVAFLLTMPAVALAIMIESGSPVFYRQTRLGQGGRPYTILKYRTMRADAEADGKPQWAMDRDPRMTRVGRLLRRIYMDEVPQFWNVVLGDMSIVGPRPERPELVAELERGIPFYRARLLVKPGITGWAQINYGKGASIEGSAEKLEYDLYYIKHRGLILDLWIVLRTMGTVIGLRGR